MNRTIGISPKVLYPVLAALGVVAQQWATTGRFDRTEIVTLLMTVMYAVIGAIAPPGEVAMPDLHALPYDTDTALETSVAEDEMYELLDDDDDLPGGLGFDAEDDLPVDLPVDDAGTLQNVGSRL